MQNSKKDLKLKTKQYDQLHSIMIPLSEEESKMSLADLNSLGLDYYNGENGRVQSYSKACQCYLPAALLGDSTALSNLGFIIQYSHLGTPDLFLTQKFWKMSAERGDKAGQNNYGYALEHGYVDQPNKKEAMKYYKLAADQDSPAGLRHYGDALENGFDGKPNLPEAIKYYKKAADLEDQPAKDALKRLGK